MNEIYYAGNKLVSISCQRRSNRRGTRRGGDEISSRKCTCLEKIEFKKKNLPRLKDWRRDAIGEKR